MNVFGINLEADIHVIEYTKDENFFYQEIELIKSVRDRVELGVLLNIKHDEEIKDVHLQLTMTYIKDNSVSVGDNGKSLQALSQLPIWSKELHLMGDVATYVTKPKNSLIRDIWNHKFSLRLNLSDLPILSNGTYAIVLYAKSQSENKTVFLDCAYFDVT